DNPHPGPLPSAPPEMSQAAAGGARGGGARGGADLEGGLNRALNYLSANFALDDPQWKAWRANFRDPRLGGTWLVEAYLPGKGRAFGQTTIRREQTDDEYTTRTTLEFSDGEKSTRMGKVLLYTGYSWRGTSNDPEARTAQIKDLHEVMLLSDD